jgi:hypothetical protein|tara:strand:- start:215 stop:439 length:225 start_codon:yes stop_codon:yes gene_type:complete
MESRIDSLRKKYESKIIEADENIKLFLKTATILPEHTDINKELDKWIEIKSSNLSKLQHILSYLPPKKDKKDGK